LRDAPQSPLPKKTAATGRQFFGRGVPEKFPRGLSSSGIIFSFENFFNSKKISKKFRKNLQKYFRHFPGCNFFALQEIFWKISGQKFPASSQNPHLHEPHKTPFRRTLFWSLLHPPSGHAAGPVSPKFRNRARTGPELGSSDPLFATKLLEFFA
jgi:hypothetical protein